MTTAALIFRTPAFNIGDGWSSRCRSIASIYSDQHRYFAASNGVI
jgi:hypothetical protein